MDWFEQVEAFFQRLSNRRRPAVLASGRGPFFVGPYPVINDAAAYGVRIEPAAVSAGELYWQAVRVHHLTPDENGGRHHLFMDMLEPQAGSEPVGTRLFGARLRVTWGDQEEIVVVEKPLGEPGANLPLWKWQVCAVQALGLPGQELPSDRVLGIHSAHPDEGPGNTLFHHSFSVTFCRVRAPAVPSAGSVLAGTVRGGNGRTLLLCKDDGEVGRQVLSADETYRFAGLGAGAYQLILAGTAVTSEVVMLDGQNAVTINLVAPPAHKLLTHYVLFGPAELPATQVYLWLAQDYLRTFKLTFGFSLTEASAASQVTIIAPPTAISLETEAQLAAGGAATQRIAGSVAEVAAALAARLAAGQSA